MIRLLNCANADHFLLIVPPLFLLYNQFFVSMWVDIEKHNVGFIHHKHTHTHRQTRVQTLPTTKKQKAVPMMIIQSFVA